MHALDNVIWRALTTRQAHLADHHRSASKFQPDVSVLGGLAEPSLDGYASMATLLTAGARVGMFLDEAIATPELAVVSSLPLLQMVRERGDVPATTGGAPLPEIVPLTEADADEMMALTALTRPGPFNRRTRETGDYFGMRVGGELVAMAGERLRPPDYTEVSAICTRPDHLGRGYAAALVESIIGRILARGDRPFLHVLPDNTRAVALYERLGFEVRLRNRYVILEKVA